MSTGLNCEYRINVKRDFRDDNTLKSFRENKVEQRL